MHRITFLSFILLLQFSVVKPDLLAQSHDGITSRLELARPKAAISKTSELRSFTKSDNKNIQKSAGKVEKIIENESGNTLFSTLVWSDEFNYEGLPDSTKWNFATDRNDIGWGNNELQWYTDRNPRNAMVSNGTLKITAIKEPTSGKNYSSARLTTSRKGDWKYGKIAVRAKLPNGRGTWPAIWMMPTESKYGGWPKSGEIDIMEHVGFNPDTVFSTVHTGKFNHMIGTQVGKKIGAPTATTEFHVYSMEWDEHEIRSYMDGVHYFTFKNNGEGTEAWPFDQPFHIIINLAIGGGLGGKKGVDDSLFPHVFEIDYVRVYQ